MGVYADAASAGRRAVKEVDEFFAAYRAAFVAADANVLVEHFAFPVQTISVVEDGVAISASAREEWLGVLGYLLGAYGTLGVANAQLLELEASEPVPDIASARVRWELRREDGGAVYGFQAVYTLARVDGRLRIASIAHDELPRLQQAMARSQR